MALSPVVTTTNTTSYIGPDFKTPIVVVFTTTLSESILTSNSAVSSVSSPISGQSLTSSNVTDATDRTNGSTATNVDSTALPTNGTVTQLTFILPSNASAGGIFVTDVILPTSTTTVVDQNVSDSNKDNLSAGAVGGIAVAMMIVGALIAAAVLIMLSKRRKRKQNVAQSYSGTNFSERNKQVEQGEKLQTVAGYQNVDFDLDRLFPQPLDDATMKRHAQHFFSQVDAHVESFYTNDPVKAGISGLQAHPEIAKKLHNPTSRLFAIKQLICKTLLDSISPESPSDRSFLPYGYTSLARRLREPNLDDQAIVLSWARLRTSLAFLLRPDATSEQSRLDSAISAVEHELNNQLQMFETASTSLQRTNDLEALCRTCASFGRIILSQPAMWTFDWSPGRGPQSSADAATQESQSQLVYFPALIRLTDNKSRKASRPHIAMRAQAMQDGRGVH